MQLISRNWNGLSTESASFLFIREATGISGFGLPFKISFRFSSSTTDFIRDADTMIPKAVGNDSVRYSNSLDSFRLWSMHMYTFLEFVCSLYNKSFVDVLLTYPRYNLVTNDNPSEAFHNHTYTLPANSSSSFTEQDGSPKLPVSDLKARLLVSLAVIHVRYKCDRTWDGV